MKPRFLEIIEVLETHKIYIELYGGNPSLIDLGLLQSALAQPSMGSGEDFFHNNLYEMAAAYLFHISQNHSFIDGNKRTALACCLLFLKFNGINSNSLLKRAVGGHIKDK